MANYPYFPNRYFPNSAAAASPTAAEIATAVWGKELPGAFGAGTAGYIVDAIADDTGELQTNQGNWTTATGFSTHSAGDVWNVSVPGAFASGKAGNILGNIVALIKAALPGKRIRL